MPPQGRGHLPHRRFVAQGRHRGLRPRMHGRDRLARRPRVHQPPLRLRLDPGAVVGRSRLPQERLLGDEQRRGAARAGARNPLRAPHPRRDARPAGQRARHRRRGGARPHRGGEHPGADRASGGRARGHGDPGEELLRRQPLLRFRDGGIQGHPSGRRAPLVDRQLRRRHRQLDVAPPYGRLRHFPRLRLARQPSGGLLARERALPCRKVPQGVARRLQGGRLRHGSWASPARRSVT